MNQISFPDKIFYSFKKISEISIDQSYDSFFKRNDLFNAHINRKKEFLAGRIAASEVIKKCGINGDLERKDSIPVWPKMMCGSLTHDKKWALAVGSIEYCFIGIDLEEVITKKRISVIEKQVLNDNDIRVKEQINTQELYTIIFCAKEAFYKFLYPKVRTYFGFSEASIIGLDTFHQRGALEFHSSKDNLLKYNRDYQFLYGRYYDSIYCLFYEKN